MCGGNFKSFSLPLTSFHQNIEPKEIDKNLYDLIIVGAGPAGLNSALQAKKLGLNYVLLEAGKLGQGIILNPSGSFYPGYKGYFAPLKGDLWFQSAPKDLLIHRWREQSKNLTVHENEPVIDLRQNHNLWIISNQRKYQTKYVVLAAGFNRFPFPVNFPNVFIIGRAGGAKSITHSANQGFEIVKTIAEWLGKKTKEMQEKEIEEKEPLPSPPQQIQVRNIDPQLYDVVITGAGPAGIEAALQAKKAGLNYVLLDKEGPGAAIKNHMKNKKFSHTYGGNEYVLKGNLTYPNNISGYELINLWNRQVQDLNFISHKEIIAIQSGNPALTLITKDIAYKTKKAVFATGIFENQRKLYISGEKDNPTVLYQLNNPEQYKNKKILIIGGGNSAAETAVSLADNNRVILIIRKDIFAVSVTPINKEIVENLIQDKKIEIWFKSEVKNIKKHRAYIRRKEKPRWEKFNFMFIHIGFEMPLNFLKQIGVKIKNFQPVIDSNFETNISGLYITGSLAGANSIIQSANQGYDVIQRISSQQVNPVRNTIFNG